SRRSSSSRPPPALATLAASARFAPRRRRSSARGTSAAPSPWARRPRTAWRGHRLRGCPSFSPLPPPSASTPHSPWRPRVAGQEGLEPPTPGFGNRCSTIELLAFILHWGTLRHVPPSNPPPSHFS